MTNTGRVFLIGAGPGDPELLTLRALRLLQSADVVVHDRLVSDEILALCPLGVRRMSVGKEAGHHSVPQDRINTLLVELARSGLTVARLKGGDPLIFGRGSEEASVLAAAGIHYEFVPGITAAQAAAASTGVPLTHRGLASSVRYVTGHRALDASLDLDWAGLASQDTTLVIYMGSATIAEMSGRLMAAGLPADLPALAVESASSPRERRLVSTLGAIADSAAGAGFGAPVLFIIGRVVALAAAGEGLLPLPQPAPQPRRAANG